MRNKYQTIFTSKNEEDRTFDLVFFIEHTKRCHFIDEVQVYDRKRDVFLTMEGHASTVNWRWRGTARSFLDYLAFDIEIEPVSTGAAISIIEKVITQIHSVENLQPCN